MKQKVKNEKRLQQNGRLVTYITSIEANTGSKIAFCERGGSNAELKRSRGAEKAASRCDPGGTAFHKNLTQKKGSYKMKTRKKLVSILCAAALLVSALPAASAVEPVENGFDTLSISMDDYYAATKPTSMLFHTTSEYDIVKNVCEAFIAVGRASVRSPEYSLEAFSDLSQDQVEYRQSEYQYLAALYEATDVAILRDDMLFSDFEAEIDGTSATASVIEKYTYYTNDFDGYNFRMRKYTFSLDEQGDENWVITGVVTDDPWETSDFSYEPYSIADVDNVANAVVPIDTDMEADRLGEKVAARSSGLYKWTYNTSAAVEYAEHFFNASATGGYNPLFPFKTNENGAGVNCQNFASQCVWAGLIGDCDIALAMTSRTALPAVTASRAGSSAKNVWSYEDGYTSAYDGNPWVSSTRFAKMIKNSNTITEGPYGNTHYGNLNYADVGDVIHINWSGEAVDYTSTLNHAMFVTAANGDFGSRMVTDLKIAANSSSTNAAYQSLVSYVGKSYKDKNFSTSIIDCGYYSIPRDWMNFN